MDGISPACCCHICSIAILDDDLIHLFKKVENQQKVLTVSGELYEELMGLNLVEPACICSSCDLQIKLFKRLKQKALLTHQKLESKANLNKTCCIVKETHIEDKQETIFCNQQDNDLIREISLENHEEFDCIEYQEESSDYESIDNLLVVYGNNYNDIIEVNEKSNITSFNPKVQDNEQDTVDFVEIQYLESENEEIQNLSETEPKLLTNLYQNSENEQANSILYKCKECNMKFEKMGQLRLHRQKNHPLIHRCTKCPKTLRSAEALAVHLNQHLGLPAYSCNKCHKTFKQKVHYQYHIKRHNNERPFKCLDCGKGYVTKSDLNTHMRQHSGIRPYICTFEMNSGICGKKCYTEQHLKLHMYHHSGSNDFECDICHRKFVSPTVLHTHRQSIHMERRYECTFCGQKFRRKHHLEVHLLTHENNSVVRDEEIFSELVNTSLDADDVILNMETKVGSSNKFYDDLIEVDEQSEEAYIDDSFVKDLIENCGESNDSSSKFYNIYST